MIHLMPHWADSFYERMPPSGEVPIACKCASEDGYGGTFYIARIWATTDVDQCTCVDCLKAHLRSLETSVWCARRRRDALLGRKPRVARRRKGSP